MRVSFVLPGRSERPSGGFKIVYEYANRLAGRGHEIAVLHPWTWRGRDGIGDGIRSRAWVARFKAKNSQLAEWFDVDARVALVPVPDLAPEHLPRAGAVIATAWQTASAVAAATAGGNRGFHLIQGHETWQGQSEVRATWHLPLRKIVISRWLQELADEMGEGARTTLVRNGIDFAEFGVDEPPEARPLRVGAIAGAQKGIEDLVAALSFAKGEICELEAVVFGTAGRPDQLPEWVEYVRQPGQRDLRALYNSCAIFVQASRSEGWGLPATEAMASGCALVTYDNGGSREYAIDGSTAVVTSHHDAGELGAAIVRLGRNAALRLSLAEGGLGQVAKFTWDRSLDEMESVLDAASPRRGSH